MILMKKREKKENNISIGEFDIWEEGSSEIKIDLEDFDF